MSEGNYEKALVSFLEAYKIDSLNSNINFKVGYCYLKTAHDKEKARFYLEKAAVNVTKKYDEVNTMEKKAPVESVLMLGHALHLEFKFDEAIAQFVKYKNLQEPKDVEKKRDADRSIEIANTAKEYINAPLNVVITNVGDSINSEYPDYSPALSADENMMIFTSRRNTVKGAENGAADDGMFYEDIFVSYKQKDGSWSSAKSIGPRVNTSKHEASISLTPDGNLLFIYKDDGENNGDVYYSTLDGDEWSFPEKLGSDINTQKYQEPSACLSADGNTLYFVSDRKGGLGGRDIYRCVKLPNGKWSLATNLGAPINTEFDEDAPFLHPDGVTLYFSSKGNKNMGGYDIFFSSMMDDLGKLWTPPTNIGYPINTPDDDIFYVTSPDGKRGYYASNKEGSFGEKDIYKITIPLIVEKPLTLIKGFIQPAPGTTLPEDLNIVVTNNTSGEVVGSYKPIKRNGSYSLIIPPGSNYKISYQTEGNEFYSESIFVPEESAYQEISKEVRMNPVVFKAKTTGIVAMTGSIKDLVGNVIPGARIVIKDNAKDKIVETYKADPLSGAYYFLLPRGINYNISFEADGYLFSSENIDTPIEPTVSKIERNITLEKPSEMKVGSKIMLRNIFFDFGKASLRPESKIELDKIYKLLNENKSWKVELGGHTDNKGKSKKNLDLSQKRAQAAVSYLVKKGIKKDRIVAKGYGDSQPVAPNEKEGKDYPDGRQQNRRVELKILEIIK